MVDTPTLESIVSQAVADAPDKLEEAGSLHLENPDKTKSEKPKEELKAKSEDDEEEEEGAEEAEVEEVDEYGLTKVEQLEAKQLLAALKDKDKSVKVIELLARENGFVKGETAPKEAKAVVKGMVEDLKEALGDDLAYLADKMGPVFEKHLKAQAEEALKPIKDQIDQETMERESKKARTTVEELGKIYFDGEIPETLVSEMTTIMDRVKPTGGQSVESYLKEVLAIAAVNKGVELKQTSKSKAEKVLKNRNDAPSRLASEGSRSPKIGEKTDNPRKQMTLDESIRAAIDESARAN